MGGAGTVAVLLQEEERRTLDAFRQAGAINSDRATPLAALGLGNVGAARRFIRAGVLRAAGDGAYYLDEAALRRHRRRTPVRALAAAAVVLAGGLAFWVGTRSGR